MDETLGNFMYKLSKNCNNNVFVSNLDIDLKEFKLNKEKYASAIIINEIQKILKELKNVKYCGIVFDGKPLYAKMVEQVKRKIPNLVLDNISDNIKDYYKRNNLLQIKYELLEYNRSSINRNSDFMKVLIEELKVINSEIIYEVFDKEDGEGEHIIKKLIFNKIKNHPETVKNILIYSTDGDVNLLAMILNITIRELGLTNNVDVMSSEVLEPDSMTFSFTLNTTEVQITQNFKKPVNENFYNVVYGIPVRSDFFKPSGKTIPATYSLPKAYTKIISQYYIKYFVNNIDKLEEYFLKDINEKYPAITNNKKNILLKQYITLMNFFGNDFIPKILSEKVSNIGKYIKIYNNYLVDINKEKLKDYLTKDDIKESIELLLDSNNLINKKVLLNFMKLLNDSYGNNDIAEVIKYLNKESNSNDKNLAEYIEEFLNKSALYEYSNNNTNNKERNLQFILHMLYGNYYIEPELLKDELKVQYEKVINDLKSAKNDNEILLLENYYFELLDKIFGSCLDYFVLNKQNSNPFKINMELIRTFADKKTIGILKRSVPFGEIIKFNENSDIKEHSLEYLNGFQYVVDLYFNDEVKNNCWNYRFSSAPRIPTLIIELENHMDNFDFNYTGIISEKHKELFNLIDHQLTVKGNTKYMMDLLPYNKYYNLENLFLCENVRFVTKCDLRIQYFIVPVDDKGNIINIFHNDIELIKKQIDYSKFDNIIKSITNKNLSGANNNYYQQYLKYKKRYLEIKKN